MTENQELKPCPKCKCLPIKAVLKWDTHTDISYFCLCELSGTADDKEMAAITAWNARATQQPLSKDGWEDVHLRVFKDDQYKGPGHKCISYRGVIYHPDAAQQPAPQLSEDEAVEVMCKAYNDCVDELGDQAMERYCNDVPMRAAYRALLAMNTSKEG